MASNPVLTESADLFDKNMLRILTQGGVKVQTGTDKDGNAVLEMIDIPAALLGAFERRLHHCGMSRGTAADTAKGGHANQQTIDRLRAEGKLKLAGGGTLPPLSTEDDAATRVG